MCIRNEERRLPLVGPSTFQYEKSILRNIFSYKCHLDFCLRLPLKIYIEKASDERAIVGDDRDIASVK